MFLDVFHKIVHIILMKCNKGTKGIFFYYGGTGLSHVKFEQFEVIDIIRLDHVTNKACESQNCYSTLNFLRETNIVVSSYLCIFLNIRQKF
jgi:hypothetical protein